MCAGNPCDGKICHGDLNAICRPNLCGGCNAVFYKKEGGKAECSISTKHDNLPTFSHKGM